MHHYAWAVVPLLLGAMFGISWKKLPYFPIEISRAMASSKEALLVIRVTSPFLWFLCQNWYDRAAWACFLVVAFFDDVNYWVPHMIGVAGMAAVTARLVLGTDGTLFWIAAALYAFRAALRYASVWLVEGVPPARVHQRVREIERTGYTPSPFVLNAFRVSGFIQWTIVPLVLSLFIREDGLRDVAEALARTMQ